MAHMSADSIKALLIELRELAKTDPEAAHNREDRLYRDFVKVVASEGNARLRALAAEVLRSATVDFPRWSG